MRRGENDDGGAGDDDLERVLEDLELQATGLHLAERAVEVDELTVAQDAEVHLVARLLASVGRDVRVSTTGPDVLGTLAASGTDWLEVADGAGGRWSVALRHVVQVAGLGVGGVPEQARPVAARLSLRSVLRRLAEDRADLAWYLSDGRTMGAAPVRVGADFVDVRVAGADGQVTVPLAAVVAVRWRS